MTNMENKTKQPELLLLPIALMNEIIAYLNERPYREVTGYINAIQRDGKLIEVKETAPVEEIVIKKEEPELDALQLP